MPRLDCGEKQINETAQQLMRGSFVEIVLYGQFCFGDQKSVFGGGVGGFAYQKRILQHMKHVTQDAFEPQGKTRRNYMKPLQSKKDMPRWLGWRDDPSTAIVLILPFCKPLSDTISSLQHPFVAQINPLSPLIRFLVLTRELHRVLQSPGTSEACTATAENRGFRARPTRHSR
ncbi:hypothetical protein JOB18_034295 [Solea senegalensis]|uniref:Uncharacterized protein n=1 Tax=Solea senegalensis TaxID=28829 RepID=A0AAV6SBL8_SOLSE|nr:hypothetical protein JOB18_034295 [Solea senegalensis]